MSRGPHIKNPFDHIVWAENDCWEWTRGHSAAGYGFFRGGYVHRWTYQRFVGSIPEGYDIDHLCRNRGCCNPMHLEAVTHAENMRRGYWGMKTHCPKGHPYDEVNTQINGVNGGRQCIACIKQRKRDDYRTKNPVVKAQGSRTHCPQGHPYEGDNIKWLPPRRAGQNPRRDCRECRRASALRRYYAKKEAAK